LGLQLKLLQKTWTDCCNFDVRDTGFSAVAVTELLCSQVCYIQLVMFLSGFTMIVFSHDAIRWQVFLQHMFGI
jgi:hypothetical protein